jgi:glycosyltransferase involved in cell wall biosynthesis
MPAVHDFVYVGSGESHKNHRRLIDAWILLAQEGCHPSLALTVDVAEFPDLCDLIEAQKRIHGLRIENKGALPPSRVAELYKCSGALIYPSTLESLGLPLIEARNAGLAVLAGELDYVRDVLNPEETFDPNSAVSIARAVKRFRRMAEPALQIVDAGVFVDSLQRD